VTVAGLTATLVATGYNHTCALERDGTAACWGENSAAQLGDGTTVDRFEPTRVLGLSNATALAGGAFHSCATTREHSVLCWGLNDSGQLGDGTTAPHAQATPILGLQ
jgi:alpha-tubulin suppressor-like RCC1 family protein